MDTIDDRIIIRGSERDRLAYRYALAEQGYAGSMAGWLAMPIAERMEYEHGAAGGSSNVLVAEAEGGAS